MFSYRIFKTDSDTLLAIADKPLLGKEFAEGDCKITVSREFYHENFCDESTAMELARSATIINAVGENIISLLIKEHTISRENILLIGGIPHAQVVAV